MLLVASSLLFLPFLCYASAAWYEGDRDKVMTRLETIETTVKEMSNHIKKQDRFEEIKDLLQIDSTLKKLQEQNEELKASFLSNQGALGRSGGQTDVHQGLERSLDELRTSVVEKVEGTVQKMEEVQDRAAESKRDLDKKLGKMMNIMTSLYEANEKESSVKNGEESSVFLTEYMDVMEQRIKEELSVVSTRLHRELKAVERAVSSILDETPKMKNGGISNDQIQVMVESAVINLTRRERDIEAQLQNRVQALEKAILQSAVNSTTEAPATTAETSTDNNKCRDMIQGNMTKPQSCWDLHKAGAQCDGVYAIFPQGRHSAYVYCDMTGGGWTLLMRRGDFEKRTDFHRTWNTYKKGFGNITQEFWLGNENIHLLTKQEEMVLKVHLEDFHGNTFDAEYDPFSVGSESENYKLHLGPSAGVSDHLGASFRYHNHKAFSTWDRNNDTPRDNCPERYKGGWWYNRCHYVLLTAPYFRNFDERQKWQGIQWHSWKGTGIMKSAVMKIRPKQYPSKSLRMRHRSP